jgi:hypothetical protein
MTPRGKYNKHNKHPETKKLYAQVQHVLLGLNSRRAPVPNRPLRIRLAKSCTRANSGPLPISPDTVQLSDGTEIADDFICATGHKQIQPFGY